MAKQVSSKPKKKQQTTSGTSGLTIRREPTVNTGNMGSGSNIY
jgi:hypothetical protein